jgi:hypothetical protein
MKIRRPTALVILVNVTLLTLFLPINSLPNGVADVAAQTGIAENVELVGHIDIPGSASGVAVEGNYAYIAESRVWDGSQYVGGGLRIIDVSNPAIPTEVGIYDAIGWAHGIAVTGTYAYVVDGTGLHIVNVTNPAAPNQVGFYDTPGSANDVVTRGDYAYIADWTSGLRIINVSNPVAPIEVGFYDTPAGADDVAVVGDYAYVADQGSGLRIINVANPTVPTEVGFYDTPGSAFGVAVVGNYAYVADYYTGGLRIVDVANPAAPFEVGHKPAWAMDVAVTGDYAYVADLPSGLRVVNVANPTAPTEVGFYNTEGSAYGVTVTGGYIYVADGIGGLVILRFTGGPDISHIEVTQATQTITNSVPLIAGKPTFVRVYVDCGAGCSALPNVTGVLLGSGTSGELGAPLSPFGGAITARHEDWQNQRDDLRRTLNFELPQEWLTRTITLTAEVNQLAETTVITFTPGNKLRVAWVSMPYSPPQPPPPPGPLPMPIVHYPDQVVASQGTADLLAMYPVAMGDVTYVFQPGFDERIITPFDCSQADCPADAQYLRILNDFWNRMSREGVWMDGVPPDRLYGWVPQEAQAGDLCGIADAIWANPQVRRGRVAAGVDGCGAETLAHELGHLLNHTGLRHAPGCGAAGYDTTYPYPNGSIGEWGMRTTGGIFELINPTQTYDFMSYCSPEWVSSFNYERLNQGFAPVTTSTAIQALASLQRQFLASGIVFSPALTATLNPLFVITSTVPPDPDYGGAYCLELRNTGESLLDARCFDLNFTNPETGELTGAEGFSLALPYPDGTQAVVLTHSGAELARATASPHVPEVQVLSPNGGETWQSTGTYTITWTASDADGETLHYAISFSPDGGVSWNPLVLDTTETQWPVDAGRLPGSTNAKIRVEASDDFQVGVDISDAPFTVERKGPQVFILLPREDVTIPLGTPLWLQGYAYDLEDGTLDSSVLNWTSSLDGDLGTGNQVLVTLLEGEHVIKLTATDSDGNLATDSLNVFVGNKIYLPIILK